MNLHHLFAGTGERRVRDAGDRRPVGSLQSVLGLGGILLLSTVIG
ncbi:hypothetical protein [Nonomuraea sp. NPDC050643]